MPKAKYDTFYQCVCHHDSLTDELIDGRLRRGLLGLAGDQGVLHERRHVQLEREREVGVHLAGHCHDV